MKKHISQKLMLLAVFAITATNASAYDVYIDGIYYNFVYGRNSEDGGWVVDSRSSDPTGVSDGSEGSGSTYVRALSVTSGDYPYHGHVTIPASANYNGTYLSVYRVEHEAFRDCKALLSVNINCAKRIYSRAFMGCTMLQSVRWDTDKDDAASRDDAASEESLRKLPIFDSAYEIGDSAFFGCVSLKEITTPEIDGLHSHLFEGCTSLERATIKWGSGLMRLTTMGEQNFKGCTSLKHVYTNFNPIEGIYSNNFDEATYQNATLHVPKGRVSTYQNLMGWKNFQHITDSEEEDESTSAQIISFKDANVRRACLDNWDSNCDGEFSEAEAAAVTSIDNVMWSEYEITNFDDLKYFTGIKKISCFNSCNTLSSITIPKNVTVIDHWAFAYCENLKDITFMDNEDLDLESVPFYDCTGLNTITLPKGCYVKWDGNPFEGCRNLEQILVDEKNTRLTSCDGVLFSKDMNTLITYPEGKGTTYAIPEGTTKIGRRSFAKCKTLKEVIIPSTVSTISIQAFEFSGNIEHVVSRITEPFVIDESVFSSSAYSSATLVVPEGTVEKYRNTKGWMNFTKIEEVKSSSPNVMFPSDVTAQSGQQVTLPIEINSAADLTVVGISFTLSLPQGVTVETDEDGEPVYELVSSRLNPKRFSVYSSQDAGGAWGFRIAASTATAALVGNSGAAITLSLNVDKDMADGSYTIGLTGNIFSVRDANNSVNTVHLADTNAKLTVGGGVKGDVNGDGAVDVADIATIISVMAGTSSNLPQVGEASAADVNGDGAVDVADIATVISIMAARARLQADIAED